MKSRKKATAAAFTAAVLIGGSFVDLASAAWATPAAAKPKVTKLAVSPAKLPARGGTDTVTAQVAHATKVVFDVKEVSPVIGSDNLVTKTTKNGKASIKFILPANRKTRPVLWEVSVVAHAGKSSSFAKETTIIVAAAKATPLPPPTK